MSNPGLSKPLNLAFLGCGYASRLHSKTLSHFKEDVRCYYASRDRAKAMAYNQKYRGNGYFDSYEAAINSDDIDVILIATPPVNHLELTLQAMRAGKHVIVEKPPFFHAADFDAVRQVQRETGSRVLVAENYYYKPLACKLREIIKSSAIGEVLFLYVNALKNYVKEDWRSDETLSGGGALFEGGIHWINLIANLGLKVKSIQGFCPGKKDGMEKSMLIAVKYAEGAVGTLYHSWEIPSLFQGLRISTIFGREGRIRFESNGLFILVTGTQTRLIIPDFTDIAGYKAMFRDFICALGEGEEAQMNLDLAQQDLMLIEKSYQSCHNTLDS
ncbi:MAG: Gfo/Idh/MocA family protein [Xenococcaceae cyanobacterium]